MGDHFCPSTVIQVTCIYIACYGLWLLTDSEAFEVPSLEEFDFRAPSGGQVSRQTQSGLIWAVIQVQTDKAWRSKAIKKG